MSDKAFEAMTDEEVVVIAQSGSDEAFEYVFRKFRPQATIKSSSYYLAGGDRDDLIQEGFIGLYKAIMDYNPQKDASFKSFADLCITRQIITAVKAARRLKHTPLNTYVSLDKPYNEENYDATLLDIIASDGSSNPETIVIGKENLEQVEIKMEEVLSPFECKVLSLYLTGKSYSDIASTLKKDAKSIDNALQRIKKKFEKFADEF